jgi:hypothetical protein
VSAYQLDVNGYPVPASRADFIVALSGALGAVLDPLTNDFLFSTFGGLIRVIRVSGFSPPVPGVTVTESGGSSNVAEGGATDTYTVVLNAAPTANVTVTINSGTELMVAPATLTFTPANWAVPQTVTVTAVDDALVEGPHTGMITHTATSADAAYNGIAVASVTANITDNDSGTPGPGPAPGSGGEGSYPGSTGNGPGSEGSFGFGRSRLPTLWGPLVSGPADVHAYNITHRSRMQAAADDERSMPAWSIAVTVLVMVGAAVGAWRSR